MTERQWDIQRQEETIRFLYTQRLSQFNVRRDHEWKIVFGVLVLLGAVDASLITGPLCISPWQPVFWVGILALLLATVCYEFIVQKRNRVDRIVMDSMQKQLCEAAGIARGSKIRVRTDSEREDRFDHEPPPGIRNWTYLWAFWAQVLVLLFACAVSFVVPHLACDLKKEKVEAEKAEIQRLAPGATRHPGRHGL